MILFSPKQSGRSQEATTLQVRTLKAPRVKYLSWNSKCALCQHDARPHPIPTPSPWNVFTPFLPLTSLPFRFHSKPLLGKSLLTYIPLGRLVSCSLQVPPAPHTLSLTLILFFYKKYVLSTHCVHIVSIEQMFAPNALVTQFIKGTFITPVLSSSSFFVPPTALSSPVSPGQRVWHLVELQVIRNKLNALPSRGEICL